MIAPVLRIIQKAMSCINALARSIAVELALRDWSIPILSVAMASLSHSLINLTVKEVATAIPSTLTEVVDLPSALVTTGKGLESPGYPIGESTLTIAAEVSLKPGRLALIQIWLETLQRSFHTLILEPS